MDYTPQERRLIEYLRKNYSKEKINCPDAQAMAGQWDVETNRMAAILSELGIKINSCMLGCFK